MARKAAKGRKRAKRSAPKKKARRSRSARRTRETSISVRLNVDGRGRTDIDTGIGFLDHMLELVARHAMWDLKLVGRGDRQVDDHHLVEDAGIVLGAALNDALGSKKGVSRYGWARVPMDEAMAEAALDLSGRAFLFTSGLPARGRTGSFDLELVEEFLRALAENELMTLHVEVIRGRNRHHVLEAAFKSLGRALRAACSPDPRERGVPSTKGRL
ncbi:MAG: imidazoleglycerol-phosphate dehydratase HisB [Planctomycetota bacterium]|jgi:imidazoleglycerol-phosphate dehydratase